MTKKTLVSAITAALVVGAASTTFAAANPFSDVPADSWAYDAVTTLAHDGVIDGFPDGTFQGQKTMTRYEMAQITARAMAKTDLQKADKALVDKLAAEFAEELDNLGVRVSDLEKKSDNVKWGGELRYRYKDINHDNNQGDSKYNKVMFRLEPKAFIGNSGWTANARINYLMDLSSDSNNETMADNDNDNDSAVDEAYVQGPLFGATVTAGRLPVFTAQGLLFDDRISGAQVAFGSDVFKTTVAGGRYSEDSHSTAFVNDNAKDVTAEYYGVQFDYTPNTKLALNAGYTTLTGIDNNSTMSSMHHFTDNVDNNANFWYAGGSYAFTPSVSLVGEYAQNTEADDNDQAWIATLNYKNADVANAGSWGLYAGYANIENNASIAPTYDEIGAGQKGFVAGASYVPAENILATIKYFDGKDIGEKSDTDASMFFGQVEFFF